MWLAYLAMTAALLPLVLMGVGYFFVGRTKARRQDFDPAVTQHASDAEGKPALAPDERKSEAAAEGC